MKYLIAIIVLMSALVFGQTVTITGTVQDRNGNAYSNGYGSATLIPQNQNWLVNGTNPVQSPIAIGRLNSFGYFSIALTNTSLISPSSANPQWQFSFCSSTSVSNPPLCFTMTPMSLTSSQDISSQISSQAAVLPANPSNIPLLGASNTFTGTNIIAVLNTAINPTICGVSSPPVWCSGSDIGAWINAAYAEFGGVEIDIPAGNYTATTDVVFGTAGECPVLKGAGYLNTKITWAATSGTAVTFNCYSFVSPLGILSGFGLRDISLVGPNATGTDIGLVTGGSNGAAGFYGEAISVSGFNTNLQFANNAWMWKCLSCNFDFPGTANVYLPSTLSNTGENLGFIASTFENSVSGSSAYKTSCFLMQAAVNLTFTGGSFENCQYVQNTNASGSVLFSNVMFGNFGSTGSTAPYGIVGAGNVTIVSGECGQANTTGNIPTSCWAATAGAIESHGMYATNANSTSYLLEFAISGSASLIVDESIQGGYITQPPYTFSGSGFVNARLVNGQITSTAGATLGASPIASGTAATLSGTGACATRSGQLGGSWAGQVSCTGTTGASTLSITPGQIAPNGWSCWASDVTHGATGYQSAASTTVPVISFSSVTASDVIIFGCQQY